MRKQALFAGAGLILLFILFLLELSTGSLIIPFQTVWSALWGSRETDAHLVVSSIRLPRACIALAVGAGMAVAGACMQALIRNSLASPELLGINSGAALAIVIAMFVLPASPLWVYNAAAFAGGLLISAFIFLLASSGHLKLSPLSFIIAGTAVSLFLGSLTQGVLILNEQSLDDMRFWLAGSVTGRTFSSFAQILPFIIIGLIGAILLGKRMNALQLGDEMAAGLGESIRMTKGLLYAVAVLLSAACVTTAGPIAFIGLAVPHLVRSLSGPDYRWIVLHCLWCGAALLMFADTLGKLVIHPREVPVGIMTVMLGAPFFIYVARQKDGKL
jgi:ABC-type Fe3+-siderophore transport system, permease component